MEKKKVKKRSMDQFAFGFNEPNFSDRILCVVPCEPPPPPLIPMLDHPHKHEHEISIVNDQLVKESKAKKLKLSGECVTSSVSVDEREKEHMVSKEKEKEQEQDSQRGSVVQLHVSSLLLAAKSGFFKAIFAAGMKETTQKQVSTTLH